MDKKYVNAKDSKWECTGVIKGGKCGVAVWDERREKFVCTHINGFYAPDYCTQRCGFAQRLDELAGQLTM